MNFTKLLVIAIFAFACSESSNSQPEQSAFSDTAAVVDSPQVAPASDTLRKGLSSPAFSLPYHLEAPDAECKLPRELEEISGLSYLENGNLAVIEDEKGKIYQVNTEQCEVGPVWKFGKDGDYEGVEVIGDTAWVVRSDGLLYKVTNYASEDRVTEIFKTPLSSQNDVEGLAYLPEKHQLLIACKAAPYLEKRQYKGKRAIYAFDLTNNRFLKEPYLLINLETIQPSGIAVHPVSGHIYVIASAGKRMLVYNPEKQLIGQAPLDKKRFRQPEGICFSPEGTLYISNEGAGGAGYVLTFQYTPHEK